MYREECKITVKIYIPSLLSRGVMLQCFPEALMLAAMAEYTKA